MKVVLEFNYPDDIRACERAVHADDAFKALVTIDGWLNKKFQNKTQLEDALSYVREITSHALTNLGGK